ncbi:hypothetical protein GPECTOR_73g636 [Gonium pectorale]|uniref:Uncharacterized protein n=1 Tax=Gonium pectorale TaxID=33097 RepID=A0A150G3N0_GONPE|nr:hypothetical protein GPECTOR_73g636 [Gonium pectorale]|eukprot:KXZ44115.1 hypothetical protein GPECTOR_73g636 [Gonium pectorale]
MYKKEFMTSLQAKGKLERPMTAADERRVLENNQTATRIFPSSFGRDAVLDIMVQKATARIDAVTGKLPAGAHVPSAEAAGRAVPPKQGTSNRHALEARVNELELEIRAERERRSRLEREMSAFRSNLSSRGGGCEGCPR